MQTRLVLAPMAGITDLAFRSICREMGAGLTYTEMVSAKALYYGDEKTASLLVTGEDEHPVSAQIFGSDPASIEFAAGRAAELSGADFIDINMGCPVNKIAKSGDGSGLMRDMPLAKRVMAAAIRGTELPVTIKMRKGWDAGSVNAVDFAKMAEDAGIAAIAVHGRTRSDMYAGKADWDIIKAVKQAVTIPVMANGDVTTAADVLRILDHTGADAVMIGRGVLGNPWIFQEALALLEGKPLPPGPSIDERVTVALRQFERTIAQKGERIGCLEARKHFAWYLKGIRGTSEMRRRINGIETQADIWRIAEDIRSKWG